MVLIMSSRWQQCISVSECDGRVSVNCGPQHSNRKRSESLRVNSNKQACVLWSTSSLRTVLYTRSESSPLSLLSPPCQAAGARPEEVGDLPCGMASLAVCVCGDRPHPTTLPHPNQPGPDRSVLVDGPLTLAASWSFTCCLYIVDWFLSLSLGLTLTSPRPGHVIPLCQGIRVASN